MKGRGPLIRVEISPGRMAKMYKQDAIEAGLVEAEKKVLEPKRNKILKGPTNKAAGDNLGVISGVGESTVKKLNEMGVFTFEQLKDCELGDLHYKARQAIEDWRESLD